MSPLPPPHQQLGCASWHISGFSKTLGPSAPSNQKYLLNRITCPETKPEYERQLLL
jgi:hypothetical protein